ncbi:ZPR1 zinc finger domain-containing protein [Candidatus Woesearchaeota archaeon]|nr:ZPR1 zinc finger domain-containing protein [Candidatus Woesearchaeota archaeon]
MLLLMVKGENKGSGPAVLDKQPCPMCKKNTLTLTESETEVPYFGKLFVFSMSCSNCGYHKADVESEEQREPVKITFEVEGDDDLKTRIVKGSEAKIKIPHITTIEPGPASNGYVTNVEGILNRVKHQIEELKENEEDTAAKKKAKNMLKKLQKVLWGKEKIKIIIEDHTGNSAIISEKAAVGKLK